LSDAQTESSVDSPPIGDVGILSDNEAYNNENDLEDDLINRCLDKSKTLLSARKMKQKGHQKMSV
jgi:hypothetical protein